MVWPHFLLPPWSYSHILSLRSNTACAATTIFGLSETLLSCPTRIQQVSKTVINFFPRSSNTVNLKSHRMLTSHAKKKDYNLCCRPQLSRQKYISLTVFTVTSVVIIYNARFSVFFLQYFASLVIFAISLSQPPITINFLTSFSSINSNCLVFPPLIIYNPSQPPYFQLHPSFFYLYGLFALDRWSNFLQYIFIRLSRHLVIRGFRHNLVYIRSRDMVQLRSSGGALSHSFPCLVFEKADS